jgi:hypothetical protein
LGVSSSEMRWTYSDQRALVLAAALGALALVMWSERQRVFSRTRGSQPNENDDPPAEAAEHEASSFCGGIVGQSSSSSSSSSSSKRRTNSGGSSSAQNNKALEAARAAALSRVEKAKKNRTDAELRSAERRTRLEVLGKIEAHYASMGKDPPIGLAAAQLVSLRRHLTIVKEQVLRSSESTHGKIFHHQKPSGDNARGVDVLLEISSER